MEPRILINGHALEAVEFGASATGWAAESAASSVLTLTKLLRDTSKESALAARIAASPRTAQVHVMCLQLAAYTNFLLTLEGTTSEMLRDIRAAIHQLLHVNEDSKDIADFAQSLMLHQGKTLWEEMKSNQGAGGGGRLQHSETARYAFDKLVEHMGVLSKFEALPALRVTPLEQFVGTEFLSSTVDGVFSALEKLETRVV